MYYWIVLSWFNSYNKLIFVKQLENKLSFQIINLFIYLNSVCDKEHANKEWT